MRNPRIAAALRPALTLALLLSATVAWAASASRDVVVVDRGKVVAAVPATKRVTPILGGSAALRTHSLHAILDWKDLSSSGGKRILLTTADASASARDLHKPAGADLWQVDSDGAERLIDKHVLQARLSPDAHKLLYATAECNVAVETEDGRRLLNVPRGYDPHWKSDGSSIVLSLAEEGSNPDFPGGLRVATVDVATGQTHELTEGVFDDVRPEFHPSGRWVLFVSGGRSGIASFWRVPTEGGKAKQLTNTGATSVDAHFVPTPYGHTRWSSDGRWFVYDYKSGEKEEVWGLEFDGNGDVRRAVKLATGLNPQWTDDGVRLAVQTTVDGETNITTVELPQ